MTGFDMTEFASPGKAYSWKGSEIGTTVRGVITQAKAPEWQRNYGDDGDELVAVITIEQEDGEETALYVVLKPSNFLGNALADAVDGKIDVGGRIAVQYTGDKDTGKGNPARMFKVEYAAPAKTVLLDVSRPAEAVTAPTVHPAPAEDLLDF